MSITISNSCNAKLFQTDMIGFLFRRGALECLEQLHLAGFQHGDVSPHNFGARNGEMVILDFSQAEHCEKCGPCGTDDTCYEIGKLKETLFGNSEVRILFTQVGQVPLEEIV